MKKAFLILSWAMYLPTLFFTLLALGPASAYWTGANVPKEVVVAGLDVSLEAAIALTIPITIWWWQKSLGWGTFCTYAFLLSCGLITQSVYQELKGNMAMSSMLMFCGVVAIFLSVYFMYKYVRHEVALVVMKWRKRPRFSNKEKAMPKDSRAGGKFCPSHTTCTPPAAKVADIVHSCEYVTNICFGSITSEQGFVGGHWRVKITDNGKSLLLCVQVQGDGTHQELWVYVSDLPAAKLAIMEGVHAAGFGVLS